jgi:integrase
MRISETLAVVWSQVDFKAGTVQITGTLIRVEGEGPLRGQGSGARASRSDADMRHVGSPLCQEADELA